ncbi:hypothetical protein ACGF13_28455 [Kitasatospora sp. NPDC048286]|uniref:hypothetical protein n=1 Tax=Kitasatospora sp. NPDC048286 TaxID=3364047 RepID=UPI00370FD59F
MNASVIARIAKIVPLAVVAAAGVAACGPTNGGSSVAASAPSVSSSATPGAGAVPTTPAPADTTPAAPTTATPAAEAPAGQAPAAVPAKADVKADTKPTAKPPTKAPAKPAGGIGITFNGLHQGQKIQVGNQVSFSVTWKNNDATGTRSVAPVVATQQYEGAQCQRILSMAKGTLERKDTSGWKAMPSLSQGGGTDYTGTGNDAAFTLAAGESRTVEYRMVLDTSNHPGRLLIEADAVTPSTHQVLTKGTVTTSVIDSHRPTVASATKPTPLVTGTTPTEFTFNITSPDGPHRLRPTVYLSLPSSQGLTGQDVTVEAKIGNEWKSFEVTEDCNGRLGVAPAQLDGMMNGNPITYTFRVGLKRTPTAPVGIEVGAASDGHYSAATTLHPTIQH